jgi:HlyD family secretion protein
MKRSAIVLLVVILAAAAGAYAYWGRGAESGGPAYITAAVERGPITAVVTATGIVTPVTTVKVGTYVSGPILALDVDFNSAVRKGQRVAKIDPAPFQVRVLRAEANVANARARVEKSKADLELKRVTLQRTRELRARDIASENDLDTASSNYDQARAQLALDDAGVQQAEAELREARINLAYTDITSPVDGVVVSRSVDVGQTVAASFQTPTLFEIAEDLAKMQVGASVSESDIGGVREGQTATFNVDAFPGRTFSGQVVQVRNAPINVQNVVTYDVIVNVENRDLALKPGMTATVTITIATRDDALRIPLRALSFDPARAAASGPASVPAAAPRSGDGVWRLDGSGELERIAVETGLRDETFAEVTGGDLQSGDEVVVAARRSEPSRPAQSIPGVPRMR